MKKYYAIDLSEHDGPMRAPVYRAADVEAYRAETGATIHALQSGIEQRDARVAALEKYHTRYEKLRRLDPRQFHDLWLESIATGEKFDDLVDRLSS